MKVCRLGSTVVLLLSGLLTRGIGAAEPDPLAALDLALAAAESSLQKGDLPGAETRYREALFEGWMVLGTLERLERRPPAARAAFQQAVLLAPDDRGAQQALAGAHLQAGEAAAAVAVLSALAARDANDVETRRLLAKARAAAGDLEGAVRTLDEAAARRPRAGSGLPAGGRVCLAEEGGRGGAPLRTPARSAPHPRDARPDRAHVPRRGRLRPRPRPPPGGAGAGPPACGARTTTWAWCRWRTHVRGRNGSSSAVAEFRAELKIAPGDALTLDQLGSALLDSGRPAEAQAAFEAAVAAQGRALHLQHLGASLLALDRPGDAAAVLRRALARARRRTRTQAEREKIHYQLGLALRKLGLAEEASSHLAEARRLSARPAEDAGNRRCRWWRCHRWPSSPARSAARPPAASAAGWRRASMNLGVMRVQARDFTAAAALFEQAAELKPDLPRVQYALGIAWFNARRYDKAAGPLARALEEQPDSAELNVVLGQAQAELGDYAAAAEALQRALRLKPDVAEANGTLGAIHLKQRTAGGGGSRAAGRAGPASRRRGRAAEPGPGAGPAARPAPAGRPVRQRRAAAAAVSALAVALAPPARTQEPKLLFRDVTREAGITFEHHAAPEKKYIVESMSGGVALFDFDNDGRLDIYFVDSLTVDTARDPQGRAQRALPQPGRHAFQDVTDRAGVGHPGWGMGVCTADVDGDGWPDLYVTALGAQPPLPQQSRRHVHRHRRRGGGRRAAAGRPAAASPTTTATATSTSSSAATSRSTSTTCPSSARARRCEYRGIAVQCGPRGLPGESDFLFRNEGNGRFTDVSAAAGVADPRGYFGLGVAWFDYDADGWPDLYVANDSTPSLLYHNQKDGTFKEVAFPMGVAVSDDGGEQGGMGVAVGDYDRSGRFSLFKTNFAEEYNNLYRNEGTHFTDVAFRSGTGAGSLPFVGWGTAFFDYDNDGWLDLMVVQRPRVPAARPGEAGRLRAGYRQRRLLYRNLGDGHASRRWRAQLRPRADRAAREPRPGGGRPRRRRPHRRRDQRPRRPPAGAAQRDSRPAGHWLRVKLRARAATRDAIGAVVTVRRGAGHADAPRAERHQLPLAGRHAPALRPGRGRPR